MLGFSAKSAVAATAAAVDANARRTAANRNAPAATKHAAVEMEPAMPLRHHSSEPTKGSISQCGSGSHPVPIWSYPGVCESKMRRAMLRCASASP